MSEKNTRTSPQVLAALRRLERGGKLEPESVVEAARAKSSPLHRHFEWSDTKAAHEYRLDQARRLIRVHVEMLPGASSPSPIFVSLKRDRDEERGGYRRMVTVLSDAEMRQELLDAAHQEMVYFRGKYGMLKELAGVIDAMAKVEKRK